MSSGLESEDIDNGPLVRMEDVQPSRDRVHIELNLNEDKNEFGESYIVDHLDYDNECVVEDNECNIENMTSIHSEGIVDDDNDSGNETILHDVPTPHRTDHVTVDIKQKVVKKSTPQSWPTLEILPGGVINYFDKCDDELSSKYPGEDSDKDVDNEMMYACAKCSRSFKFLYCLVQHVRWHEKEESKLKEPDISKLSASKPIRKCLHILPNKKVLKKTIKRKTPKKSKS